MIHEVILPGAGDVSADGFGGAVAEGGEVLADDVDAAALALCADLGEDLGCGDAAAGVGEPGHGVGLERGEDAGGAPERRRYRWGQLLAAWSGRRGGAR